MSYRSSAGAVTQALPVLETNVDLTSWRGLKVKQAIQQILDIMDATTGHKVMLGTALPDEVGERVFTEAGTKSAREWLSFLCPVSEGYGLVLCQYDPSTHSYVLSIINRAQVTYTNASQR